MDYCEHGYPIPDPEKLPHKRTMRRIEVCEKCAVRSSLSQMGSGMKLSDESLAELKEAIRRYYGKD